MKPKLILIGGAPGVGKSAVASALFERLPESAYLDGDDVWQMNPFRVDERTKPIVISNIRHVLRNYIAADFHYVILAWVMHQQGIIDDIMAGLQDLDFDRFAFTLVCDEVELARRWEADPRRGPVSVLALDRLRQSRRLDTRQIETTGRTAEQVAGAILMHLDETRSPS